MQLRLPATSIVALGLVGCASAANLRNRNTNRKLTKSSECIVEVAELLEIEPGTIDSTIFECEMDSTDMNGQSGLHRVIKGNKSQMAALKTMHENGKIVPGETVLSMGAGTPYDNEDLFVPPGLEMSSSVRRDPSRRRLAVVKGVKPMLAVRVTDSVGKVHINDATAMSYNIFGGGGDEVNLKSQMYDCSMEQLTIQAGVSDSNEVAPGMVEVTINVSLEGNSRGTIRNAVTTAVQNLLGHSLPGPYQQVMYNLEGCYQDCGWAAYAYVNSWNSVYQSNYYLQVGVQMHEIGHNFNLAHSGGLNGATYTDHTGLMGNPLYSDEVGKMCFNAAKNYQIGWYTEPEDRIVMPINTWTTSTSEEIQMVGVANYLNTNRSGLRVVTKLETGTSTDYYIAFNRAVGVNSQNDEADNEVTIVEAGNNGVGYSQSFLKATLVQGESYTFTSTTFGKQVTVTATAIDLTSDPAVASVCVSALPGGTCGTSAPVTSPPTKMPVTSPPTKSPTPPPTKAPVPPTPVPTNAPTKLPTFAPTKAPVPPTLPPTNAPTDAPTLPPTNAPTNPPTPQPTNPPVAFSCTSITTGGGDCKKTPGCYWDKGSCKDSP